MMKLSKNSITKAEADSLNECFDGSATNRRVDHGHCTRMLENMRMNVPTFVQLCQLLRDNSYITKGPYDKVSSEKRVAIGLYGMTHNVTQRVPSERFQHSTLRPFTDTCTKCVRDWPI